MKLLQSADIGEHSRATARQKAPLPWQGTHSPAKTQKNKKLKRRKIRDAVTRPAHLHCQWDTYIVDQADFGVAIFHLDGD